jgi:YHS domain-containing protein
MSVSRSKASTLTCPVCGMEVDENSEFSTSSQGEIYYFCSDEDLKEFQKHPSQYLTKQEKAA